MIDDSGIPRVALGAGLVLRSVEREEDIPALAEFNRTVHGEDGLDSFTTELILRHPRTSPRHWLYIEDTESGRIAASLCLLPWDLTYGGVPIRSAEMGIVGTGEGYRGRGLNRILVDRFDVTVAEEGFPLSHIQGIPYFYRRFGYEYAVPLEPHVNLELRAAERIAARIEEGTRARFSVRRAVPADIPALMRQYDDSAAYLDLRAVRSPEVWQYILGPSLSTCVAAETFVVTGADGKGAGYFRIAGQGFGEGLILQECSVLPENVYPAVFGALLAMARERGKPYIRCNLPSWFGAGRFVLENGGCDDGHYRWQMKIPDISRFVNGIREVLDRRLAESDFSDYDGALDLDLYSGGITFRMGGGKIRSITPLTDGHGPSVRIPPNLLPVLLLGDRTLDECALFYPDLSFPKFQGRLFSALFPPMRGYLFHIY